MAFDEVQFPPTISYGSRGGPKFLTDVVTQENAFEQRVAIWGQAGGSYNARYGVKSITQLLDVIRFFYARMGRFRGFRYKDWLDYEAFDEVMVVDGSNQIQTIRNYVSGPVTFQRIIRKPVAVPAVTMRRNSVPFAAFSLDTVTGIATLTPDATASITSSTPVAISAISLANPAVVTSAANDFIDFDIIKILGAASNGMVELPDGEYLINQLTPTTFELVAVDSTLFTAYDGTGATAFMPGIARSNPVRVRSPAHGYTTEIIFIDNVLGMTQINEQFGAITLIDADRFSLPIDSSLFTEYASAGDAELHLQPGTDVMDWTGQFDVPVRFDVDQIQAAIDAFDFGSIPDIPLVILFND